MERELRIGNWITQNEIVCQVYQIEHRYKDVYRINDIDTNKQDLKPIPITQQWLERLGFESIGMYKDWVSIRLPHTENYLYYHCDVNEGGISIHNLENSEDTEELFMELPMKYVHQLQNLFFSLTGQELKPIEL